MPANADLLFETAPEALLDAAIASGHLSFVTLRHLRATREPRSYLAFDFGARRRIGIAIGNNLTATARALTAIDASNDDARFAAVGLLVREATRAFVVGRPTHPDGTLTQ